MTNQPATEAAPLAPLTVDTQGLALLLGLSPSWIEKRVAARDWTTGKIPVPLDISSRRRLWLRSGVADWLHERQAAAERRVKPMLQAAEAREQRRRELV